MSSSSSTFTKLKADSIDLESRISNASSKEEALKLALKAAELCMQAIKLATTSDQKSDVRTRCQSLLDEAERIKQSDKWLSSDNNSGNSSSGLRNFSQPFSVPPNSQVQAAIDPLSDFNVTTISSIPTQGTPSSSSTSVRRLIEPVSTRQVTTSEQILLLRGSKLNGFTFPPWKGPPKYEEFVLNDGEAPFLDKPEPCLSRHQLESFEGWRRAHESIPPPSWFPARSSTLRPTMQPRHIIDLVQDAATDCSVVASLCAGAARGEKGHVKIYSEIMYPWDTIKVSPQISPNGKYILRLNFNGCYRRVVIDDRLPVSTTKRLLHIIDRRNPDLLWPPLLEKAYLKVRGGYDFPGSNSSTDLWILTGWIPEQVFLQDDTTEPDTVWKRMFNAFEYGDVLVTMGTGKMSNRVERELGLAGQHDYAVLDMKLEDDQKLVLLKNPWCEGTSWKGSLPQSTPPRTEISDGVGNRIKSELPAPSDLLAEQLAKAKLSPRKESEHSPGTFWMDWNNIMQHFESIYLNWNPGLFSYRQDIHFAWDLTRKRSAMGSFIENPQFAVSSQAGGSLWLLLCRHFQTTSDTNGDKLLDMNGGRSKEFIGHISLYVYDRNGQRIHISASPVARGPYVDSPQTLLRLEIPPQTTYTVVVSEQDLPDINHTFSLVAFSSVPVELSHAQNRYPFTSALDSAWTSSTAGGGAHIVTYSSNPQFSLEVPNKTSVALLLETPNSELNVHVKLVHSGGKRLVSLSQRDIVIDSGEYRRGSAFAELQELDSGTYTIICSTFEAGQKAGFSLRVDTFVQTQLKQLPGENAGRLSKPLAVAAFNWGNNKIAAPIFPRRLIKISAVAKYRGGNIPANPGFRAQSPVRISIELGRGPTRRFLAVSADGEFLAADGGGVRTPEMDLWPEMRSMGDTWLVLERMASPAMPGEERFGVELWCDGKPDDVMQVGVWRAWDD